MIFCQIGNWNRVLIGKHIAHNEDTQKRDGHHQHIASVAGLSAGQESADPVRLDGLGLVRAMRAGAATRLTPIVMITTESEDRRKQEGKAAGATGWIVKPFTPEQLLAVVRRVLGA